MGNIITKIDNFINENNKPEEYWWISDERVRQLMKDFSEETKADKRNPEVKKKRIEKVISYFSTKFKYSNLPKDFITDFKTKSSYDDFLIDEYIDAYGCENDDGELMTNDEILDKACGDFEWETLTKEIFDNDEEDVNVWCDFFNVLSRAGW